MVSDFLLCQSESFPVRVYSHPAYLHPPCRVSTPTLQCLLLPLRCLPPVAVHYLLSCPPGCCSPDCHTVSQALQREDHHKYEIRNQQLLFPAFHVICVGVWWDAHRGHHGRCHNLTINCLRLHKSLCQSASRFTQSMRCVSRLVD